MQEEIKNIESSLPHENSVNSCRYNPTSRRSKEIKSPVTFSHLTFDYSAKLSYNKEYMIK